MGAGLLTRDTSSSYYDESIAERRCVASHHSTQHRGGQVVVPRCSCGQAPGCDRTAYGRRAAARPACTKRERAATYQVNLHRAQRCDNMLDKRSQTGKGIACYDPLGARMPQDAAVANGI